MLDPLRGGFHGFWGEAAAVDTAVDFALEQTRRFENTDVFGDGWEGEWKWFGEFSDGGFALRQAGKNGAAGGIGEGGEGGVERSGLIVNHMVNYR